jgi:hypothetical protein
MPRAKSLSTLIAFPPPDDGLFHDLFDILHETCLAGNWTATARILDVSIPALKRWNRNPPQQRYWIFVLQHAIREVTRQLRQSPHKKHRRLAKLAIDQLSRHRLADAAEQLEKDETADDGVVRHLLSIINEAPGQTISTKDLKKARYSGEYSLRAFRYAAERLQLDKETEGFGADKVTYWSMPRD